MILAHVPTAPFPPYSTLSLFPTPPNSKIKADSCAKPSLVVALKSRR